MADTGNALEGTQFPDVTLYEGNPDTKVKTSELTAGKKVCWARPPGARATAHVRPPPPDPFRSFLSACPVRGAAMRDARPGPRMSPLPAALLAIFR